MNNSATTPATQPAPAATGDNGLTPEQKLQKSKADLRKTIAEADKAEADAQKAALPSSDVKPREGKVEVGENVGLVGQAVAYRLLDTGARRIAEAVKDKLSSVLIVEDRDLTASEWAFLMVSKQLAKEKVALAAVKDELATAAAGDGRPTREFAPAAALVTAQALLGATAGIVGMFKSDYAIKGKSFSVGSTPLVAAVASHLVDKGVAVDGFSVLESELIKEFWEVRDTRLALAQAATKLKSEKLGPADQRIEDQRAELKNAQAELDKKLSSGPAPVDLVNRIRDLTTGLENEVNEAAPTRALVALADAAVARFDAFATAATTGDHPPLLAAAVRERLHEGTKRYSHVLFVSVEGGGAETITRNGLWRGAEAGFLGGLELSYLLLKVDGSVLEAAGTEPLLGHVKYGLKDATLGEFKELD